MPVFTIEGCEGPFQRCRSQSLLDVSILSNVPVVIDVDERVVDQGSINADRSENEDQGENQAPFSSRRKQTWAGRCLFGVCHRGGRRNVESDPHTPKLYGDCGQSLVAGMGPQSTFVTRERACETSPSRRSRSTIAGEEPPLCTEV